MAWTVISNAFLKSQIDFIIAGADLPNTPSIAVMRRLGMRFRKNVLYPLGAGVEYALHRDDVGPLPKPVLRPLG
jgi:RimJ/RimL family protein N-acetyltransferase